MADAPPPIAGSSLQAGFLANEIGKDREARRAGEATTARRQSMSINDAGDTVETTDSDSRVFSDAEGGGSQGRNFDDPPPDDPSVFAEGQADTAPPFDPPTTTLDISA